MPESTTDLNNERCPICLTDKYLNQSMKLLVSPCFHKLCENCVNRLFLSGPGPCPVCKQTLRKSNFVVQTFDDLFVEKEVNIRKRISRYFNKRREDFKSLRDYNDYLEETESLIFNLINNVDVQATEERIEKFRLENRELINQNLAKQVQEEKLLQLKLLRERKEKELRKEAYARQQAEDLKNRKQEKRQLIEMIVIRINEASGANKTEKKKKPKLRLLEKVDIKVELSEEETMQDLDVDEYFEPLDSRPVRIAYNVNVVCP